MTAASATGTRLRRTPGEAGLTFGRPLPAEPVVPRPTMTLDRSVAAVFGDLLCPALVGLPRRTSQSEKGTTGRGAASLWTLDALWPLYALRPPRTRWPGAGWPVGAGFALPIGQDPRSPWPAGAGMESLAHRRGPHAERAWPPMKAADSPSCSSMRRSWLYLATRSERAGAPALI